jgi:hypothetical protein
VQSAVLNLKDFVRIAIDSVFLQESVEAREIFPIEECFQFAVSGNGGRALRVSPNGNCRNYRKNANCPGMLASAVHNHIL